VSISRAAARRRARPVNNTPEGRRLAARVDLVRVATLLGRKAGQAPNRKQYQVHGRFGAHRVMKYAGTDSWPKAMRTLGLRAASERKRIELPEIRADINRVRLLLGLGQQMPTPAQQRAHGSIDATTIMDTIGEGRGWHGAAFVLGLKPQGVAKGPNRAHVITRGEILADYQRVAADLGFQPGSEGPGAVRFTAHVGYTYGLILCRFGSMSALSEAAGFTPRLPNNLKYRVEQAA
jgi:hypothetical protein